MSTPAKKAFVITSILYALLLLASYFLFQLASHTTQKHITLTPVPVTLSMFQNTTVTQTAVSQPAEVIQPPTPPIEPVKAIEPSIKTEPKITPLKISPPPKKSEPKPRPEPKPKPPEPKPLKPSTPQPMTPPPKVTEPIMDSAPSIPPETPAPNTMDTAHASQNTPSMPVNTAQTAQAEESYLSELNATIAQHAYNTYPRHAKRRNWQGEVRIQFTLLPNGRITHLSIIESSGHQVLDKAALRVFQVKMNQQFKPFPEEIVRAQWNIEVPVSYNLTH